MNLDNHLNNIVLNIETSINSIKLVYLKIHRYKAIFLCSIHITIPSIRAEKLILRLSTRPGLKASEESLR